MTFPFGSPLFVEDPSAGPWNRIGTDVILDFVGDNVGIGTTTPSRVLEISGAGDQFLRVTSTDDNQAGVELFKTGAGNNDWRLVNDSGSFFIKASVDDFTNTINQLAIRLGGNSLLDPTTVDVSTLTMRVIRPSTADDQAVGIGFVHDTSNQNVGAAIIHERLGSASLGSLHFATKSSSVPGADIPIRMTIDAAGLVGIGTVTPTVPLEVNGITLASNLKTHALIEVRDVIPNRTIDSSTFATLASAAATTFSGRPLLCLVSVTMFPNVTNLTAVLAIQVDAGADNVAAQILLNETEHNTVQGAVIVTPTVGSHTLRIRWRRRQGAGILNLDANDQILLHVIEL